MWCQATRLLDQRRAAMQGLHRDTLYLCLPFTLMLKELRVALGNAHERCIESVPGVTLAQIADQLPYKAHQPHVQGVTAISRLSTVIGDATV